MNKNSDRNLGNSLPFLRYLIVGGVNSLVTYGLFLVLLRLQVHYLLGTWLAAGLWVWWGFELQRIIVFRARQRASTFGKFLVGQGLFSLFSTVAVVVLVEILEIDPELAYLISLMLVSFLHYVASKKLVFQSS